MSDLSLQNLNGLLLRRGDQDREQIWGGSRRSTQSGTPVTELQNALIKLGTLTFPPDGAFGQHTEEALQRFQWYVAHLRLRLKLPPGAVPATGTIVDYAASPIGAPGACDAETVALILSWLTEDFVTTTPLVRLNIDSLNNVEIGAGFQPLDYPDAKKGEVLVHANFAVALAVTMNEEAGKAGVHLHLNQTFRRQGVPPTGAVVQPATRSQHLVGHAVDLNIADGSALNTAALFEAGKQTKNAEIFVAAVKERGLRWGGNFSTADFVHFDAPLDPSSKDYDNTFFFAQRCFEHQHPMRLVT
jgi:hypothetical protein